MSEGDYTIIIGGSSGVGRALVQQCVYQGRKVLAVARDIRDLDALRNDCLIKFGNEIKILAIDITDKEIDAEKFLVECTSNIGTISTLFITVGATHDEDRSITNNELIEQLTLVNYLKPAQLISSFTRYFQKKGVGNIIAFTSITTVAPRRNNAAYAAAKTSLEFFCRAMQHHLVKSKVRLHICSLGYVDTSMSFGLKLLFPVVSPERVAEFAIQMSKGDKRFAYYPRFWWLITAVLRALPWFIYKHLKF